MGNRCNVVFVRECKPTERKVNDVGPTIYLHWNGGPESVYAFLAELDRRGGGQDVATATPRFVHIVCDLFDDSATGASGSSVYIADKPNSITPSGLWDVYGGDDNGFYVVTIKRDGSREIRRFVEFDGRLHELKREAVLTEEREAREHECYAAITARLKALRPMTEAEYWKLDMDERNRLWDQKHANAFA